MKVESPESMMPDLGEVVDYVDEVLGRYGVSVPERMLNSLNAKLLQQMLVSAGLVSVDVWQEPYAGEVKLSLDRSHSWNRSGRNHVSLDASNPKSPKGAVTYTEDVGEVVAVFALFSVEEVERYLQAKIAKRRER